MFTIIKGYYINLSKVTYYVKTGATEIMICFSGSSDNYIRIEFDSRKEADSVALRLCGGHIGNLL